MRLFVYLSLCLFLLFGNPLRTSIYGQVETEVDRAEQEYRFGEAMTLLASGAPESLKEAVQTLKRLAVEGHARSQYYLAQLYIDGYGLTQNLDQGKRWLERAAESGSPVAALQWAGILLGDVSDEDNAAYEKIRNLLELVVSPEARDRVSPEEFGQYRRSKSRANYLLGLLYLNGWGVEVDKQRSLELMMDASRTGDKDATMTLAIAYAKGDEVERDVDRSKEYFELFDLQSIDEVNRSVESVFAGSEDAGDRQNLIESSRAFGDAISDLVSATQTEFAMEVLDEESEDYDPAFAATLLKMAADRGYEVARLRLGVLCYRGLGVEKSLGAAAEHFEAGARADWVLSKYNLAAMIRAGEVESDLSERTLLEDAADRGLYAAELALDENSEIVPLSPEEARDLCVAAAEKEDARALFSLGIRKRSGWLVEPEPDLSKIVELYVKSSNKGFKRAQYLVGMMRMAGEAMPADPVGGFELVRSAAYQGVPEAVYTLGRCYLGGLGVEQNVYKAYDSFKRAAELGYQNAYNSLATFHFLGILVPKNEYKAAELYLKAADEDDAEAAQNLGNCYLQGVGVEMSTKTGLSWISKSAELGRLRACYQLADIYQANLLVDRDDVEVAYWEEKAAELGDKNAMKKTAFNYYLGRGHPQNKGKAMQWVELYLNHPAPNGSGSLYYPGEYESMDVIRAFAPADYAVSLLQGDLLAELGWSGSNRTEAKRIYLKMLEKGSFAAKLRYCKICFEDGTSSRDAKKSLSYLKELFEENEGNSFEGLRKYAARSARLISMYYERGYAVKKSETQRLKWLESAADLGDLESQRKLGEFLTNAEQGRTEGIAWFLKAARSGDAFSRLAIARLHLEQPVANVGNESIIGWLKALVDEGSGEARVLLRKYGVRYKEVERKPGEQDTEEPEFDPWAPVGAA